MLQEVFMYGLAQGGAFDPAKASAITWLAVLARNKAIDRLAAAPVPAEQIDAAADVADDRPSALRRRRAGQDAAGCATASTSSMSGRAR